MKAMTTRGAAGTYESLAILDKDKMMNFINEFGGQPYQRRSIVNSLDNT